MPYSLIKTTGYNGSMRVAPSTEAKARLEELLRNVEFGETIAITRHGKTIAHLIPAEEQDRLQRKNAVEEFRRRRSEGEKIEATLEEMLEWRHDGHRI